MPLVTNHVGSFIILGTGGARDRWSDTPSTWRRDIKHVKTRYGAGMTSQGPITLIYYTWIHGGSPMDQTLNPIGGTCFCSSTLHLS